MGESAPSSVVMSGRGAIMGGLVEAVCSFRHNYKCEQRLQLIKVVRLSARIINGWMVLWVLECASVEA